MSMIFCGLPQLAGGVPSPGERDAEKGGKTYKWAEKMGGTLSEEAMRMREDSSKGEEARERDVECRRRATGESRRVSPSLWRERERARASACPSVSQLSVGRSVGGRVAVREAGKGGRPLEGGR